MTTIPEGEPAPRHEGCAFQALRRGDPMLGTAFPARRVLLVEQPGPWGRAGLGESSFDRALAREIEAQANARGTRVLAVRRPGRTASSARRTWLLADTDTPGGTDGPHRTTMRTGDFVTDSELVDLLPGILSGEALGHPDNEPLYLVCTHSRHDTCCAVEGRPLAAALHRLRPGRVWESSHLGGERFAPNLLVLPAGMLYGRVGLDEAERVVEAAEQGSVLLARLRGRVGMPAAAQAAFAHLLHHLPGVVAEQIRLTSTEPAGAGRASAHFDIGTLRADVTVSVDEVAAAGITCSKPGPGTFLTYRPVAWQFHRTAHTQEAAS